MAKKSKKSYGSAIDKYMPSEEERNDAIDKFINFFGDDDDDGEDEEDFDFWDNGNVQDLDPLIKEFKKIRSKC